MNDGICKPSGDMVNLVITTERKSLDYIQALRGIAAMLVVLCHARDFLNGTPSESLAHDLFWPGAFGVDLFFIISGFIIIYTSVNYDRKDTLKFVKKRFFRVWPLYFLCTMAYIFLVKGFDFSGMKGFHYNQNGTAFDLINIIKSLAFIPLNLDSPIYLGPPTLFVGWTLNYEIYFYAVCAIGIACGRFRYTFYIIWFSLTLFIIPALIGGSNFDRPKILGGGYLNLTMQSIIWEFVFGAIVALLYKRGALTISKSRTAIPIIIIGIAVPVYAYITKIDAGHGISNSGKFFCFMFLCLTSCADYIQNKIKIPSFIISIGNASYSLYLIHPLVFMVCYKLASFFVGWEAMSSFWFIGIVFFSSIYTSYISYRFIECRISPAFAGDVFKRRRLF